MRQTQKNRRRDLSGSVRTPPNGSTKEERLDSLQRVEFARGALSTTAFDATDPQSPRENVTLRLRTQCAVLIPSLACFRQRCARSPKATNRGRYSALNASSGEIMLARTAGTTDATSPE